MKNTFTSMVTAALAACITSKHLSGIIPIPGGIAFSNELCVLTNARLAALSVGLIEQADLSRLPTDLTALADAAVDHLNYAALLVDDPSSADDARPAWIAPRVIKREDFDAVVNRLAFVDNETVKNRLCDALGVAPRRVRVRVRAASREISIITPDGQTYSVTQNVSTAPQEQPPTPIQDDVAAATAPEEFKAEGQPVAAGQ